MDVIITAAGKNSRMISDFKKLNEKPIHKLKLKINDKPLIIHTIEQFLKSDIKHCTIALGYYKEEIYQTISEYGLIDKVSIVTNPNNNVDLSKTIQNALEHEGINKYYFFAAGDQPTLEVETINNMIKTVLSSENPDNTLSILARRNIGKLTSAEGLGMPFCCNGKLLYNYIYNFEGNLNPVLRKMISSNVTFYGLKAKNNLELININHYDDYLYVKNIKEK